MTNPKTLHETCDEPAVNLQSDIATGLKDRKSIFNLICGNTNASGYLKSPTNTGSLTIPWMLLGDDYSESVTELASKQTRLPGSGIGQLSTLLHRKGEPENVTEDGQPLSQRMWHASASSVLHAENFGVQTLYSPSSIPVAYLGNSPQAYRTELPSTLGTFLSHCRRQLNLRHHLSIQPDWQVPVTSYSVPAWECPSLGTTPPVEAFTDLVFPAIGEYLALATMAALIAKGRVAQHDMIQIETLMAGSVLANLKCIEKMVTMCSGIPGMPDVTDFKVRMDFASKFVDAAVKEIGEVVSAVNPGRYQAVDISKSALCRKYSEIADLYGTSIPYKPFNRGRLVYDLNRYQADRWKLNPVFMESRLEAFQTVRRWDNIPEIFAELPFDEIARKAFNRSYPPAYCDEVVSSIPWSEWSASSGRVKPKGEDKAWAQLIEVGL